MMNSSPDCSLNDREVHILLRRSRSGDREAFKIVVRAYQKRVFAVAYTLLKNKEDALDIVQETFLRVYEKAYSFREGASFGAWVVEIARNLSIDHYRRNRQAYQKLSLQQVESELSGKMSGPGPDTKFSDLKKILFSCLERLAGRQRMVFMLRHFDELQFNEISRELNISEGTAKSLHFKAVRNLRKWLAQYSGERP